MKTTFTDNRQLMPFPVAAAIAAGTALAGQGIQMGTAPTKNKRQYNYQKKLMDYQTAKNQSMALFNNEQQMKMWRETGPTGQMEQLKLAGLNPGLIYGMGGAGGQTAQAAQAAGPSGGNMEAVTGTENMGIFGMQLGEQIALMQAQKENIQADTKVKETTAENTTQDTAVKIMTEKLQKIEEKYQDGTLEQRIANIATEGTQLMAEARSAMIQANIDDSTQETRIKQMEAELGGTILSNLLTGQQRQESKARMNKMAEDIAQGWKKLDLEDKNIAINQQLANLRAEFPDLDNVFARDIRAALDKMWTIINPDKKREDTSTNYKKNEK